MKNPPIRHTLRLRIGPEILFVLGMNVLGADEKKLGQAVEMLPCRRQLDNDPSAYERVLTDAMRGAKILFARQDYAEEVWCIVNTVMQADTPINEYQPKSWGANDINQSVLAPGGWHNPVASDNVPDGFQ